MGISAPAFPLFYLGLVVPQAWYPASVLGLGLPQAFFLLGVVAVWFCVGRHLDRRAALETRTEKKKTERKMTGGRVLIKVLPILLGGFLLLGRVTAVRQAVQRSPSGDAWGYY
jgi:hypothetical protein